MFCRFTLRNFRILQWGIAQVNSSINLLLMEKNTCNAIALPQNIKAPPPQLWFCDSLHP